VGSRWQALADSQGLLAPPNRIAGADIKDKQPLLDARKSIEKDMERFKVCEREMKMAGRAGQPKPTDPKEKAKEDAREWINTSVESLTGKVGSRGRQQGLQKKQDQISRSTLHPHRSPFLAD
jgi:CCR4-NOT transcriptional regulation complex NOT5 subunit